MDHADSTLAARAVAMYSKGRFADAAALYEQICSTSPDDAGAWTRHGACHQRLGNTAVAERSLRRALELEPDSPVAMSCLANTLAMSGRLRDALDLYRAMLAQNPGDALTWVQLGETLLRLKDTEQAIHACRQALQLEPANIRALMTLGKSLHAHQEREDALACYRRVLDLEPGHAGAHYASGWVLHELGRPDEAIAAYRRTLEHAPARVLTHFYIGEILQEQGRMEEAADACRRTVELRPDYFPAHRNLGHILRQQRRPDEAADCYRRALELSPDDAELHMILGNTLREAGQTDAAEHSFRTAMKLDPAHAEYPIALGRLFQSEGLHEQALECFRQALQLDPGNAVALNRQGKSFYALGRHEAAIAGFREALRLRPDSAPAHVGLAAALMALNRHEEAASSCAEALRLQPGDGEASALAAQIATRQGDSARAYDLLQPLLQQENLSDNTILAFANVSRQVNRAAEAIGLLENALDRQPEQATDRRANLHFSLGRLYDSEQEFDRAFHHYRLGNALRRTDFDPARHKLEVDAFVAQHSWQFMAGLPRATVQSERPVFITGMPRSGTTLVEQILASHPAVYGAGELSDIGDLAQTLPEMLGTNKTFPQNITLLTSEHLDRLAAAYLGRLEKMAPDAERVTDKMLGFIYLGLIELMLPGARVIHCVRDPLDTCLSAYFQDFSESHPYAYDLRDLGVYYSGYRKIMNNWNNVLINTRMMEVRYEELVNDQETVSRRLVEFCGLPWDDRCLHFHENTRYIATASYDQVRRPMYTSSAGRWKNYDRHLAELKAALNLPDMQDRT